MSVHLPTPHLHRTTWLPLDGFSLNMIDEHFFKICQINSSFIKILQEQQVLHIKTNINFWPYLARSVLQWEMLQTKVIEKIKAHILCSITFFFKCALYKTMWKNTAEPARPQMIILHMHIPCWIPKATNTLRICNTNCYVKCY